MEFTPQQNDAITARAPRICVDAGAGSGKTRILVERIAGILQQKEATLSEIVAITFMEKAAAEMKDRLRLTFRENAARPDIISHEMNYWRDLERRVETARLCTIHSFCTALLRENALRLGLDPDFAVLADAETALLMDEVITGTLHRLFKEENSAAVRLASEMGVNPLKNLLSTTMTKRNVLQRLAQHAPLDDAQSLLAHWQDVLKNERERRLLSLRNSPDVRKYLRQLHRFDGLCTKPSDGRELWRQIAIKELSTLLSSNNANTIERCLENIALPIKERGYKKNWDSEHTFSAISGLKNTIQKLAANHLPGDYEPELESQAAQLTVDFHHIFQTALSAFTEAKERLKSFDFDDLIGRTLQMLRENEELCATIAKDIKFLLIDEFQDTDGVQLEIARLLCNREGGPSLFIVGDAKQSIYYFRGAEVEVFQEERQRANPILPLDCNFRSVPDVLEFINHFFSTSGMLDAVERYQPMAAFREATNEPRVEFLVNHTHGGEKRLADEERRDEAQHIAARISGMCGDSAPVTVYDVKKTAWRTCSFGDIALLFRAMSNVHLYAEALRQAGIPHVIVAGGGFYTRQEVIDVLNLLKVLIDPWDEAAVLGYLRSPIGGLSDESVLRLSMTGRLTAVFARNQIPNGFTQPGALQRARNIIEKLRALVDLPLPEFLRQVLEITGYEGIALTQFPPVQRASNVRKLIDLAQDFTHRRPPSLRSFVRYIEELGSQNIREGEAVLQPEGAGAVKLMSIHKSKGLEFPVVFVPDMSQERRGSNKDALFVHRSLGMALKVTDSMGALVTPALGDAIKSRIEEEENAESARTLYVAMTRARDYLVLSGNGDPGNDSWFDELNDVYDVVHQKNGYVIEEKGWQATVRCPEGLPTVQVSLPHSAETYPKDRVLKHLAEVPGNAQNQVTFSISAILDEMASGFDEEEEKDTEARLEKRGAGLAMKRGSLIHRMLELWDFTTGTPPNFAGLLIESGLGRQEQERLLHDLEITAETFRNNSHYAQLAADSGIRRELPFLLNLSDALVNGTIDVLLSDGTIIDYKTGRMDDQRHARYEWQLLLYAVAVRTLSGHTPSNGLLYYLDEDKVQEVAITEEQIDWALLHAREMIARLRAKRKEEA
ncbi:MAG TPA: UvrD-helicase domain-containing protein [Candidatus Hydrogenedentes bacterium]|nr:UvrD-helicase domain-containing protein [Candidatus Hydrogenedentota bacterium]